MTYVIKRQRLCGIHSGQREVHDYMTSNGGWDADITKAYRYSIKSNADAEAKLQRERHDMPGVLSIVVREHRS